MHACSKCELKRYRLSASLTSADYGRRGDLLAMFKINKLAFQSKADHLRAGHTDMHFCSCDLDLMTLISELDL